MIITKLIGGLGNQMFQYAAGLSVAARTGAPLALDITALRKYTKHSGYQLSDIFNGRFPIASPIALCRTLGWNYRRIVQATPVVSGDWPPEDTGVHVRQRSHNYSPAFEAIGTSAYLSGYWQSGRYFSNVADNVRKHFAFREGFQGENIELARRMRGAPSVSIHVRRGDYVTDKGAAQFHGTCGPDYYQRALARIKADEPDAHIYLFSDDIAAARALFSQYSEVTCVIGNTGQYAYRDLMLMTQCKHHIIANSTFSWWGAWLAETPGKTVIAPQNWFAGCPEPVEDIHCEGWLRL